MKIPKHLTLFKEHPFSYEIHDAKDNKTFHVAKHGLDLAGHANLSKIQKFDEGGKAESEDSNSNQADTGDSTNATEAPQSPVVVNVGQPSTPAMVAPAAAPINQGPIQTPIVAPAPLRAGNYVNQALAQSALAQKGAVGEAQAEVSANDENVANQQNLVDQQKLAAQKWQESRAKVAGDIDSLQKAILNKDIDPNHYWHNQGTPGRIASSIGVLLGGIGMGLQHSTVNQAQEVINSRIREDIDAQKANLGKKQSLLSMNYEKLHDLDAAQNMTFAQISAMTDAQKQLAAAKVQNPKLQAGLQQHLAEQNMKTLAMLPELAKANLTSQAQDAFYKTTPMPTAADRILQPGRQPNTSSGPLSLKTPPVATSDSAPINKAPEGASVIDPSMIDRRKLMLGKAAGIIPQGDVDKISEEIGTLDRYKKGNADLVKAFSDMGNAVDSSGMGGYGGVGARNFQKMVGDISILGTKVFPYTPGETPVAGGEPGRKFDAAKTAAAIAVSKMFSPRTTPETIGLAKQLLLKGNETREERMDLLNRIQRMAAESVNPETINLYPALIKGKK